jgi:hypothetical protein
LSWTNWLIHLILSNLDWILIGFGIWLIIDGAGSIIKYEKQSAIEQLIRIIRAAVVGVMLILLGILLYYVKVTG